MSSERFSILCLCRAPDKGHVARRPHARNILTSATTDGRQDIVNHLRQPRERAAVGICSFSVPIGCAASHLHQLVPENSGRLAARHLVSRNGIDRPVMQEVWIAAYCELRHLLSGKGARCCSCSPIYPPPPCSIECSRRKLQMNKSSGLLATRAQLFAMLADLPRVSVQSTFQCCFGRVRPFNRRQVVWPDEYDDSCPVMWRRFSMGQLTDPTEAPIGS